MPQDDHTLAAKLAACSVWLSLTVDAEVFPATGQQVYFNSAPRTVLICALSFLTVLEPHNFSRASYMSGAV